MCELRQDFDRNKLRILLIELENINKKARGIAKFLENELLNSSNGPLFLKESTLIRFSKWCNTNRPYSGRLKRGAQQVAEDISVLLFGKIIDRKE